MSVLHLKYFPKKITNFIFLLSYIKTGDLGQTEWTSSTLSHIQQSNYDVLILPGDLPYADYYQPLWDSFARLVEPLASSRPWMVTQGNHEVERIPLLVEPFRAYNIRWQMPYKESGSNSNLYYSFEAAGAHVLMLGSYANVDKDSDQYKWLLVGQQKYRTYPCFLFCLDLVREYVCMHCVICMLCRWVYLLTNPSIYIDPVHTYIHACMLFKRSYH